MNVYLKALLHLAAVILAVVLPLLITGHINTKEWINVAIMGAGTITVFVAQNVVPGAKYAKSFLAAVTAALTLLVSVLGVHGFSGVTHQQWIQIVLAALGALGVLGVKNASKPAQVV